MIAKWACLDPRFLQGSEQVVPVLVDLWFQCAQRIHRVDFSLPDFTWQSLDMYSLNAPAASPHGRLDAVLSHLLLDHRIVLEIGRPHQADGIPGAIPCHRSCRPQAERENCDLPAKRMKQNLVDDERFFPRPFLNLQLLSAQPGQAVKIEMGGISRRQKGHYGGYGRARDRRRQKL